MPETAAAAAEEGGAAVTEKHPSPPPNPAPLRLALRPKEAARALDISERLLWSKTNAGEIPCVRIGRRTDPTR